MQNLSQQLVKLQQAVEKDTQKIGLTKMISQLKKLEHEQNEPNFWSDNLKAQKITKQIARLHYQIDPWQEITFGLQEAIELAKTNDPSLENELTKTLSELTKLYNKQKQSLLFSGKYDDHAVIMTIFSGAGGTDARDWAAMLLRMYLRYCEKNQAFSATVVEEAAGDEAGLKKATIEIDGPMAYGLLKSEHGVHRLVRLSPFNADNLRQTSFAKVDVLPKIDEPEEVIIDPKDLKVDVFRAGGHGGQSVNTTDSAVRITHVPTNITVSIQNERSQLQNKETAMTILRSKLVQLQLEQHQENITELKGPNEQAAWGNQIRNYVLHPYNMVKDTRTKYETSNVQDVLDGALDNFINAYLSYIIGTEK